MHDLNIRGPGDAPLGMTPSQEEVLHEVAEAGRFLAGLAAADFTKSTRNLMQRGVLNKTDEAVQLHFDFMKIERDARGLLTIPDSALNLRPVEIEICAVDGVVRSRSRSL